MGRTCTNDVCVSVCVVCRCLEGCKQSELEFTPTDSPSHDTGILPWVKTLCLCVRVGVCLKSIGNKKLCVCVHVCLLCPSMLCGIAGGQSGLRW